MEDTHTHTLTHTPTQDTYFCVLTYTSCARELDTGAADYMIATQSTVKVVHGWPSLTCNVDRVSQTSLYK